MDYRNAQRRSGFGALTLAAGLTLGAAGALGSGQAAHAEESLLFTELSTPELLELTADLDETLKARGVALNTADVGDSYAQFLVAKALELSETEQGLVGPDSLTYQVVGVRVAGSANMPKTGPLGDVSPDRFDVMAVVLFQRDFRIQRALLAPISVVQAQQIDETTGFAIDDSVWSAEGVEDITSLVYIAAESVTSGAQ